MPRKYITTFMHANLLNGKWQAKYFFYLRLKRLGVPKGKLFRWKKKRLSWKIQNWIKIVIDGIEWFKVNLNKRALGAVFFVVFFLGCEPISVDQVLQWASCTVLYYVVISSNRARKLRIEFQNFVDKKRESITSNTKEVDKTKRPFSKKISFY